MSNKICLGELDYSNKYIQEIESYRDNGLYDFLVIDCDCIYEDVLQDILNSLIECSRFEVVENMNIVAPWTDDTILNYLTTENNKYILLIYK